MGIFIGILLGVGGASMVELSLDVVGIVLGACISLLGALSILASSK